MTFHYFSNKIYRQNFVPLGFAVFVNYNRYFRELLTRYENKYKFFRMDKMLFFMFLERLDISCFLALKIHVTWSLYLYSYIYSVYYILLSGRTFDDSYYDFRQDTTSSPRPYVSPEENVFFRRVWPWGRGWSR